MDYNLIVLQYYKTCSIEYIVENDPDAQQDLWSVQSRWFWHFLTFTWVKELNPYFHLTLLDFATSTRPMLLK